MRVEQIDWIAKLEDRHWWFAARRGIVAALVSRMARGQRWKVLDAGCGTGGNAGALAKDHDVLGVDAAEAAIHAARARFPQAQFERAGTNTDTLARVEGRDLVLLMDVLEHIEDDFAFLSGVVARLQPGAHVLITVPADPKLWSAHDEASCHWRRYEEERLRAVWTGLPVEVRLYEALNWRLAPLVRVARKANRRQGRTSGGAGTDMKTPMAPVNALLQAIFAGEGLRLIHELDHRRSPSHKGVSWIAVLRRTTGECVERSKPADLAPDQHQPSA
jgi:2-polyprenyl-3-methyl-5-hydroxy-6-metoxy-1,4-benzoquinol methylase